MVSNKVLEVQVEKKNPTLSVIQRSVVRILAPISGRDVEQGERRQFFEIDAATYPIHKNRCLIHRHAEQKLRKEVHDCVNRKTNNEAQNSRGLPSL